MYDQKQRVFLTYILQRGYFVGWGARGGHSRSIYTRDRRRFLEVSSAVPVNNYRSVGVTSEPGTQL